MCERELENRIELKHIDPHSIGHNRFFFLFSWAAQPGAWGPSLSGTCSSIQHLLPNSSDPQLVWSPTDWISWALSYIIVQTPTFFLWASQIALIQPVHGQCYILIFLDWMHLLFTQVHFLFWQPGQVGGQYATMFTGLQNHLDGLSLTSRKDVEHELV